jgi:DNA-directed RNA polymerase specialized sigma24 family protein
MASPEKQRWELNEKAFEGLLSFLDADRVAGAETYENIRRKLSRLFEWRGCIPGEEFADETMNRVAKRLEEGMENRPDNPYLFFHGVAMNVMRERWRKKINEPTPIDQLPRGKTPAVNPFEERRRKDEGDQQENRLMCLHDCLDQLPAASRELLTEYHLGALGGHIGRRKGLAGVLNLPSGALRLRIFRIRRQLEKCMVRCVGGQAPLGI